MIRLAQLCLALLFLAGLSAPALAQWNGDAEFCASGQGTQPQRIHYCTLAITSGILTKENLATTYYNRGIAFDINDEFENAIADYSEAITLNPNDVDYYFNRASAYIAIGDNGRALEDLSAALQLAPDDGGIVYSRGLILEAQGDLEGAKTDFKRAYELAPDVPEIQAKAQEHGLIQ
jgi:tetratricopeptide (TPR) repeat protein